MPREFARVRDRWKQLDYGRHLRQRCSVPGCVGWRYGFSRWCVDHRKKQKLFGSPWMSRGLNRGEYKAELREASEFAHRPTDTQRTQVGKQQPRGFKPEPTMLTQPTAHSNVK